MNAFRIFRNGLCTNDVIQRQLNTSFSFRLDSNSGYFAHQISGREIEMLPLSLIHVSPDCVAIQAMKFCIDIENRFGIVLARWQVLQAGDWMPRRRFFNDC